MGYLQGGFMFIITVVRIVDTLGWVLDSCGRLCRLGSMVFTTGYGGLLRVPCLRSELLIQIRDL